MYLDSPWVLLAAGLTLAVVLWLAWQRFSREARMERRRRRNNAPVRPTVRRPMVRLSVHTKRHRK